MLLRRYNILSKYYSSLALRNAAEIETIYALCESNLTNSNVSFDKVIWICILAS